MAAKIYQVGNYPMPTTAAPTAVATGTAIKTLLQVVPAQPIRIVEWGISFDGVTSTNTPGTVELLTTGAIAATVTASALADVMKVNDPNAPTQTSGTSGVPLNLGTALTGYTASAEGTIVATREFDCQKVNPTLNYKWQFPLGREPEVAAAEILRIRTTFGTTVNALVYIQFEV